MRNCKEMYDGFLEDLYLERERNRLGLVCSFFLEYDKMKIGGERNGKPRKKDDLSKY